MATGEIKISGLPLDVDPTQNDLAVTVDSGTGTNKKVPLGELSKALDYSNSLSTDTGNLIALGTDDKIKQVASDIISTDASNTLSVGSDGKVYGSATALTLNENELFVGNASSQPISTSVQDVRLLLGLPEGYRKDDIQYVSSNQVSWQGKCRDSSNVRDFDIGTATVASLAGATANTTYNLFVASNTLTDAPVVVWDTGSTPTGYTYYRKVFYTKTNSSGNIISFIRNNDDFVEYSDISSRPFYSSSSIPTSYGNINIGSPAVKGTKTIISATFNTTTSSIRTLDIANPDTAVSAVGARTQNNNSQTNQGQVRTNADGFVAIKVDNTSSSSVFISAIGYYLEV